MAYLDPDFEKKIKTLPEDLQRAIFNLDLHQKMLDILKKYDLLISDGDDLYKEVEKVLSGESKATGFPERVSPLLRDVDKETFPKIIADIDKEIFQPIKEDLMRIESFKKANALDQDEIEIDHLKLNREDILSGIEKPVSASLHSRAAKSEESASSLDEDGETTEFKDIIDEVVSGTYEVNDSGVQSEKKEGKESVENASKPFLKPVTNLTNASEELKKKEEWQAAIDNKRAEEFRKSLGGGEEAVGAAPALVAALLPETKLPAEVKPTLPSLVNDKLTQIVKSPKEEIEVKAPSAEPKKPAVDPYREPTN